MIKLQSNSYERSECDGLPIVLCYAYLQEVVPENNPSDHQTWSIRCHEEIYVDCASTLSSHTPLVPQV